MAELMESDVDLAAAIDRIPELVNSDAALVRRGRYTSAEFLLEVGSMSCFLSVNEGRIVALQRAPVLMRSWSFAIRGGAEAWRQFWLPEPPPHFHDIFALAKRGEFRIEGDFHPLMTNLLYFKGLLAAPRRPAPEARR
jgi:hypothetical protein